ncbi:hypothetical protein FK178_14455 [Antarcticibacterium arcticum]|uniref:Uncharacterized protein n=1 Tax=Antarcticibacterium arcticum TaxID=2585771 RepID=A0A5B8YQ95_9FLAO|nr:hypothetical protein [Antarcticibacterium arcticum]QED38843.1 hypothetical protein FK178_14455 [Antarcticibacterium arcticum]
MKFYPVILLLLGSYFAQAQAALTTAHGHLQANETYQAKAVLTTHLESHPNDLKAISLLGDIAIFENKYDAALSHYKYLLASNAESADYNFKYGGALGLKALNVSKIQAMVYVPEIKKYLEKAAELDPTHIKSRRALVELYLQLPGIFGGSITKARLYAGELKKVSALQAAISQGFIMKESGTEEEAKLQFKKAFSLMKSPDSNPENNYLNYEMGKIAAENNIEPLKGLKFLDFYITNYNYRDIHTLEWAYYRKAQIQTHLRNKLAAQKLINKALSLRENFEEARLEKKKIQQL